MQLTRKSRILVTAIVSILMGLLLVWEHFHGGIPTHYILHNTDYPGFSNLWGVISIPLVTWGLLYVMSHNQKKKKVSTSFMVYGFIGHVAYAILISYLFAIGSDITGYVALGHIALSFFIPIYRPSCLLGYILGMVFMFGAVLPIIFSSILFIIFTITYKLPRYIIALIRNKTQFST